MSRALANALHLAKIAQTTLSMVRRRDELVVDIPLAPAKVIAPGLARRPAELAPLALRPITVLRPLIEDAQAIHQFALDQFTPSARRLADADPSQR